MSAPATTPVRCALVDDSPLHPKVQDGLGAVQKAHKNYLSSVVRADFADSIDLDEALKAGHEAENRWDYLLGHAPSGLVIGVEPHHATQHEISTLIKKRAAARDQLEGHLRPGAKVAKWLWVASGKVHFASTEKARLRLDQHGIEFVGTEIKPKHLPKAPASAPTAGGKPPGTKKAKS